jgi:outer membrane receptor protein involved in Fe transport
MYDPLRRKDLTLPAIGILFGSLSTFTMAQAVPDESSQNNAYRQEQLIEEIIVTATRREADIQSVPLSVTALTAGTLEQLGATSFTEYARVVPGLSYTDPGWGGEQHAIRGIKLSLTVPEVNPLTALYLDDVPIMGSGTLGHYHADPLLVDIERIEVLRGPQGTLFGASAMTGAIRILTRQPDLTQTEGFVDTGVSSIKGGDYGYGVHAMFNAPFIEDKAALRAVGYIDERAGYIDNIATGDKDVNNISVAGGRFSVAYQLNEDVRVTGRIAHQERKSDGTSWEDVGLPPRQQSHLPESLSDRWTNYNLVIDADVGWADLMASTSYLERTLDTTIDISLFGEIAFGIDSPIFTNVSDDSSELIQELRLTSKNDRDLLWVLGAFYQDLDQDLYQDMPAPGFDSQTGGLASAAGLADNLVLARYNYALMQLAIYGDASYALTDTITIGVGARWFSIDRDFASDALGLLVGDPFDFAEASESGATPRFSVDFALSDRVTFYASAAEGYRAGGVNNGEGSGLPECIAELEELGYDGFPVGYDSDSLWSYDLGAKSRWRDGRVQLNVVAYHIDWSEMQTSKFLDCGTTFVQNAGKARSDGVEVEFSTQLTERFLLSLAANYNDAELREDVPSLDARAGDRLPGTPRYSASAVFSYQFNVLGRDAHLDGSIQHVGESYDLFNVELREELPAHTLANARVGLADGPWLYSLYVDNLFDERGIVGYENDVIRHSLNATPPRTIGFSARRTF